VAPTLDLSIRICNNEKKIMYKLAVPFAASDTKAVAEVAYGEETILKGGIENPGQKYIRMTGEGKTLSILNRGIYGYSMEENKLLLSLMRAPAYTAHPLPGRNTLPSDRHMPYIEQGERLFDLRLRFGNDENKVAVLAQAYNEAPVVLSFFPSGIEKSAYKPFYSLSDPVILPTAFKLAENGQGYILRFFNPTADSVKCNLRLSDGRESEVSFGKYEIKTYRITSDAITETNLLEESK
jgi:alpha-mannosidase